MKIVKRICLEFFLLWLSWFFSAFLTEKKNPDFSVNGVFTPEILREVGKIERFWSYWNRGLKRIHQRSFQPCEIRRNMAPTIPSREVRRQCYLTETRWWLVFFHDEIFREVFLARTRRGWDVEIWKKIPSDKMDSFIEAAVSLEWWFGGVRFAAKSEEPQNDGRNQQAAYGEARGTQEDTGHGM